LSQDGSHTLISERFDVSYHSKYGAIQETQTVFIDAGLKFKEKEGLKNISILEMGFGTGLNPLMTLMQMSPDTNICFETIEAYPLSRDRFIALNYPEVLQLTDLETEHFLKMHQAASMDAVTLGDEFRFTKYIQKIEDFEPSMEFDLVYYDAFAPTSQEELWTPELMAKIYEMCSEDAILVTYCAKGSFKRALRSAGFEVEALDGPEGKREMTRAKKVYSRQKTRAR